ncbi:MAG: ATP-binding protein [Candidatus Woesebacteria bacterium]|nr:ATP-binding protein [Candidatus Woesebacteria bacterium]
MVNSKPVISSVALALKQKELRVRDIVAPEKIEVDFDYFKINDVYFRTIFIAGYPRFVTPGWLEPIVNFDNSLDISFYIYPVDGKSILDDLRRKIAEMEAEISTDLQRGKILDPLTEAKLEDARALQEQLVKGAERFFEFGFYITIPASTLEDLNHTTKQIESTLGSLMVVAKHALLDQDSGFLTTAPFGFDRLNITRNMDTTSLSTTFPLTSAELSSDTGILYGINSKNESFIIFDRFSLENPNMTIFATSGAGKSTGYDTEVIYEDKNKQIKKEKIGKLVDMLMENGKPEKIEKDIEGIIDPKIKVFSFDKNLKGELSKVIIAARKTSPKNLYRITTKSGREVEITKDHCLVTLKKGIIQTSKGNSIKIGDYIPLPRGINYEGISISKINTYDILKNSNIKHLRTRFDRVGNHLIRYSGSIPKIIEADSDFFTFLGLLASEGMTGFNRVLISNTDPLILNFTAKYLDSLKIRHNFIIKNHRRVAVNVFSETFQKFLENIGSGGRSGFKKAADLVFSAPKNLVADYLRAYFEGDGTVSEHDISATTKSKQLASDLCYLLYRFGIIARISTKKKVATNTAAKKVGVYYAINVYGQDNIGKFIENIGFMSEQKNLKSRKLIKEGNTNVDVVPEIGNIFKEIHNVLYKSSELGAPRKFSEIKLGIFKPSRQNLLSVINKIELDIQKFEDLEGDGLSTLNSLPSTEEIIFKGKSKEKNSLLWQALGGSWSSIRNGAQAELRNSLMAISITHDYQYSTEDVGGAIYRSFKNTGESLMLYDKTLWNSVMYCKGNTLYKRVLKARDYIASKYTQKKMRVGKIKEKLNWLKTLANSDLFWDPIVKIEKIKSKNKYVYDLQVDNAVFVAGNAGMFVHNSFFVKLEALRSLMLGTEVIIIDPETEYKPLAKAVGGEYISFSFNSPSKINPFDLSQAIEEGENQLGLKILSLHSLFKVIMGVITPIQEALLDRALVSTYRAKGITQDVATQTKEPPLMEDLYKTLIGMESPEALDLAARIEKFVRGSFVGIFDQQTNVNLKNPFTVFSVRDLPDALRPIAMFVILDYIWTRVKKDLRKRLLIVEEAWHMMKYPDTAQFLWSVVKRSRKYFLGLTTITQDVEDFLSQDIGKAIVTNSALQLLLKQSPAAIDKVGEVFYLSQGEKNLLLAANVGEGIFFAGPHHAPIRITASQDEYQLITSKPQDLIAKQP